MFNLKRNNTSAFTIVELLIVLAILSLLVTLSLSTIVSFGKNQSLALDTQTVVSALRQARSQTLSSKGSLAYGVHFSAPKVTLYTGPTYTVGSSSNEAFLLSSTDTILTISLTGGGTDVLFNRLSGDTAQDGTIVISSPSLSETKIVTIYKTGLIQSQ